MLWLNRKEVDKLKAAAAKECGDTPSGFAILRAGYLYTSWTY